MKSRTHLFFLCVVFGWLMVAQGCESKDAQDTKEQVDEKEQVDIELDSEGAECGSDQKVPTETAKSWIKSGWQEKYWGFGVGSTGENEVVKFGGFDADLFEALLRQCEDCPFISVSFALSDLDNQVPHAILMNVDDQCTVVTEGDTAALISTVNQSGGHNIAGPATFETAQTYIENWQCHYEFPDSFKTVYSYTYSRDSVANVLSSCYELRDDCASMLRATYAVHPDTLNGADNLDSLLMDIIFTCDCKDNDTLFFPGEFVDIANPCPQICPNQYPICNE